MLWCRQEAHERLHCVDVHRQLEFGEAAADIGSGGEDFTKWRFRRAGALARRKFTSGSLASDRKPERHREAAAGSGDGCAMQTSAAQGTKPRRGARSGQPTIEAAVAVTAACKRLQKTPIHSTTRRAGGISRLPVVSSHHRSGKFCQTASGARVACSAESAPEPLTSAILSACGSCGGPGPGAL